MAIQAIPTATADMLTLSINSLDNANGKVVVYDAMGKVVTEIPAEVIAENENLVYINVSSMPTGYYTVVFQHDGGIVYDKFLRIDR